MLTKRVHAVVLIVVAVIAPLFLSAPAAASANPSTPVATRWEPFPRVYGPVHDESEGVWFDHGAILTVSQTRALYRSGWLPTLSGLPIPGVAAMSASTKDVIERGQVVTRGGCVVILYSQTAVLSPVTKTFLIGDVYVPARGECRP